MDISAPSTLVLIQAILLSLLLALAFAQISLRLTSRIRLIDVPGSEPHKLHARPTPIAGGIALLSTLLLSDLLLGGFTNLAVKATFIAVIPLFIFGLWDDFRSISPLLKIVGQMTAALILIWMGVSIQIFESPEFFLHSGNRLDVYLDWLLTILWVVGITNAFNFVDSMDGLAVGLGGTAAAFFTMMTLEANQFILAEHSAIILGACIGLYFFNSPPARLFMGDSGAQTLGFVLAVLAIAYSPQAANQSTSWIVPILLLGIPVFDIVLVTSSRLRRGHPVYSAGHDHTYHRLVRLGLDSHRAVLIMQFTALVLGGVALFILNQPPLIANLVFALVTLVGMLAIIALDRPELWPEPEGSE